MVIFDVGNWGFCCGSGTLSDLRVVRVDITAV